jgi:maleate cis-trans isomerase|tara:strand:- start:39 stop:422 length:384 start_codon:yes stop_codon:yes gene_type:complete
MRKFFYFRDVADEVDDDDILSSIAIPVDSVAGIVPTAITTLELHLNKNGLVNDQKVTLTVTRGKLQEVMHELVAHINGHTLKKPLTVMGDAATTTVNASSIEGNDIAKDAIFFSDDVTAVALAAAGY